MIYETCNWSPGAEPRVGPSVISEPTRCLHAFFWEGYDEISHAAGSSLNSLPIPSFLFPRRRFFIVPRRRRRRRCSPLVVFDASL